jgi:hypothetical protein
MPVAAIVAIASFVFSVVSSIHAADKRRAAQRKAERDAAEAAERARGLKLNTCSGSAPLRVMYGRNMIGGNEVFFAVTGTKNDVLWIVDTYSEGPCEGIQQVDGVDQRFLDGRICTPGMASVVEYFFHDGAEDQTVDADLAAAVAEWTDRHKYTCYGIWKLTYHEGLFYGLPTRQVLLNGRKLYDFRDASTAWSRNPVLIEYDYRTNTRYGLGQSASLLDLTTYTDAANYCDTKGWIANLVMDTGKGAQDFLDEIDMHMRGETILYDSKWYKRYYDLNYESTCPAITDEHIVQDENGKAMISVTEPSRFDRPDGFNVHIIDPEKDYTDDFLPIGETEGQIESLDFYGATRQQAADLAVYELERAQLNRVIRGVFRDDCAQYECCDVLPLTCSALSLSAQLVRVIESRVREDGLVELAFVYEDLDLYNDDYDLIAENVYTCTLPNPTEEPPSVSNVSVTEETYDYRLRTFTRLKVTFDEPPDYPWFDHVEVWTSFDNSTWEHAFNSTGDFEIANVEEGKDYYIRLKTVSIYGAKQQDGNDYKTHKLVGGYTTAPASLGSLAAIVNSNAINLYATKVADPDVELYEFRLGSAWASAILLAALRSPNLSLYGVKPGSHTFMCNTLGNNGQYGGTPRSASVSLIDPPDGWTVQATESVDTLITNGDMEADANWANYGSPSANERSNTQKHEGTYSRKFTVDAANEGIQGAVFTTVTSGEYGWSAWVYPDDTTSVRVKIRKGDNSGFIVDTLKSGLTQDAWNFISGTYTESAGGAGAYIAFESDTADSGSWYIDDACLMAGTFDNCAPVLYSSAAHIRGLHSGSLVGTYTSPIFDRSSSDRYMIYALADVVLTGAGTTWDSVFAEDETWDANHAEGATWAEIFALDQAPVVRMTLLHDTSSPPANETERLEILSCIETARYYQLEVEITDPNSGMYAMVENYDLKFCQ